MNKSPSSTRMLVATFSALHAMEDTNPTKFIICMRSRWVLKFKLVLVSLYNLNNQISIISISTRTTSFGVRVLRYQKECSIHRNHSINLLSVECRWHRFNASDAGSARQISASKYNASKKAPILIAARESTCFRYRGIQLSEITDSTACLYSAEKGT